MVIESAFLATTIFLFFIVLLLIIIVVNVCDRRSCLVCGEVEIEKLIGFDNSNNHITPNIRIQSQRLHKADLRICRFCLEGLKRLN